jgi:CHAT domain-containing protein/tetratricopeptide (TPR) repeat protein
VFVVSLVLASLAPQSAAADSVRLLASRLPDSALIAESRRQPLAVREALGDMLARSVNGPKDLRENELATATRLANAYSSAWHDPFLARQMASFVVSTPERRAVKVRADSVRRAGASAYGRRGPATAIAIWRRAVSLTSAIADTAGLAGTLGNIGAGFARLGQLDSASGYLERARKLAQAAGDVRVEANAIAELAGVSEARDDIAGARLAYARVLKLRERIGDTRGLAADYNNLGLLAQRVGELEEARRQFESALALNRREGREEIAATNLVNLAGLASLAGDFARAEAFYREAVTTFRARSSWSDVADARRGLGELLLRRGDYPAARTELRAALALYNESKLLEDALAVRQEFAAALAAAGDLQGAVDELRRAQRIADSASASSGIRAGIALSRADLAVQLNARGEADRLYSSAQTFFRRAGDPAGEAEAQEGRALLILSEDAGPGVETSLAAALAAQIAAGNQRAASLTRVSLGQLALRRGDTTNARRQLTRAAADLDRLGDPVAAAAALGELAALEAAARFPATAESLYVAALARIRDRPAPQVTWQLHAGLAALRQKAGALDDAAREYGAAIDDVERTGSSLALAERRSGFLADKADVYVQFALLQLARGRAADAFRLSERVRAREMLELLAQGRVSAPPDTAAELIGREQDLRRHIAELSQTLETSGEEKTPIRGPEVSAASSVTREALARAQESYADLLLEIRERAPRHAALVSREGANWRDVARRLAPDEAFIEYLVSDASSLAFVVTRDTVAAVELGADRHSLARTIDFVRGTLAPRGSPRLDSLWRAPLRQLHQRLIAPLEQTGLLAGKSRLTLVPHADLHYLPFAALVDAITGRFLVEKYEIVVTPSAAVWLALGSRPAGRAKDGMLALAPRPDALPASRQEVAAISRVGGTDARVMVGGAATEEAFRREAPTRRVLHLATLGILNKQNPLFSFVQLAPSGTDDGRLEVHEVFGLRLTADLVVLSACQTGLGSGALSDVPPGDDWVGLARAFLYAGAARVVATLWAVQDRATAGLMERFYREYGSGASSGSALATAQRALLASPATAHPYYWAGFEVVGER